MNEKLKENYLKAIMELSFGAGYRYAESAMVNVNNALKELLFIKNALELDIQKTEK